MIKRIVIPPYDGYNVSTFIINNDTVYIGHFGGSKNLNDEILSTIEEQMAQTLENLNKALMKINLGLEDVVKLTVILRNIKDFSKMHNVWEKYFIKDFYPIRTTITSDFVDDYCLVQIEGIACYG